MGRGADLSAGEISSTIDASATGERPAGYERRRVAVKAGSVIGIVIENVRVVVLNHSAI